MLFQYRRYSQVFGGNIYTFSEWPFPGLNIYHPHAPELLAITISTRGFSQYERCALTPTPGLDEGSQVQQLKSACSGGRQGVPMATNVATSTSPRARVWTPVTTATTRVSRPRAFCVPCAVHQTTEHHCTTISALFCNSL